MTVRIVIALGVGVATGGLAVIRAGQAERARSLPQTGISVWGETGAQGRSVDGAQRRAEMARWRHDETKRTGRHASGRGFDAAQADGDPSDSGSGSGSASGSESADPAVLDPTGICRPATWIGASGFRGLWMSDPGAQPREHCGVTARWSVARMQPSGGEVEIWWQSPEPVRVAVGWGSCDRPALLCPEQGVQRLADWPEGAQLWVAVAGPSDTSPIQDGSPDPTPDDASPSGSASEPAPDDGSSSEAEAELPSGTPLALGWRVVSD